VRIPQVKPPHIQLPTIRLPIHIPHVGCPGADAHSYIGAQFGNLPDLYDALHTKHLRKVINDQIYALLKGQLPTPLRKGLYFQKALELIQHVAEIVAVLNQVIGQAVAEYNQTIAFINQKKGELNQAIEDLNEMAGSGGTAVQRLARQRYQEYLGELDAQLTRLGTSISCIVA
jgi:uncharacterized protein YukE